MNHRVLYWPSFPTTSGQSAALALALGQDSLTNVVTLKDSSHMIDPTSVTSDGTRIFVGECFNAKIPSRVKASVLKRFNEKRRGVRHQIDSW